MLNSFFGSSDKESKEVGDKGLGIREDGDSEAEVIEEVDLDGGESFDDDFDDEFEDDGDLDDEDFDGGDLDDGDLDGGDFDDDDSGEADEAFEAPEFESVGEPVDMEDFADQVATAEFGELEDFDDDEADNSDEDEDEGSDTQVIMGNESSSDESSDDEPSDEGQDEEEHPEDIVEPENAMPPMTLEELPALLKKAAANAGWKSLMPVQAKALPYMLAKRDLMVQSRTGSGKTGAFLLPILERIDTKLDAAQALILVPTRELAQQVAKEAAMLVSDTGLRSIAVYGGVSYGPQIDAFEKGAHLVIGTPGRILDHLLRRTLRLDNLKIMVFDEADRMLSMGFYPDMREVQRYLPNHRLNAYMFSATFPANVLRLAGEFLVEPDFLSLSKDRVHVSNAEHIYYMVPSVKKDRSLIRLIEIENPASAIIFCNTKVSVNYVTVVLQRFGYDADQISSDLNQKDREKVLARIKAGKLRFLVATDVAARGIDVHELSHVFQYEPPEDPESYIHRAGRTARAGATGKAVSLIENIGERLQLERIAQRYSIEMNEVELPTDEDVTGTVAERVITLLEAKLRDRDNLQTERMQRFIPVISEWASDEEGQRLLAMLLDDFYQQSLHMPLVPLDEPTETRTQKADRGRGGGRSDRRDSGRSGRRSGSRRSDGDRDRGRSGGGRSGDGRSGGGRDGRRDERSGRGGSSRRDERRDDRRDDDRRGRDNNRRDDSPRSAHRNDNRSDDTRRDDRRDDNRRDDNRRRDHGSDKASSGEGNSSRRRATRKSGAARKAAEERSKARRDRLKNKS